MSSFIHIEPRTGELLLSIQVNTIPVGQPRAKAQRMPGFIKIYTPRKADQFKADVRRAALKAWNGVKLEGPLLLRGLCVMPRPQRHFRSVKKQPVLKADAPYWHTDTPDIDNLAKAAMDSLSDHLVSGITDAGLWHDDAQVARLDISKIYTPHDWQPAALVNIYQLTNNQTNHTPH